MVTNGQKRFFGPFIAILTPVVVMYTCYDFSFTFFFKVLVVALILVVRTSNSVENWRHYEFLICATYLHFWPQHGRDKLLGQTRGIAQMMTPEPSLQQQNEGKMNHWTSQQMMRSNWCSRRLPSTAILVVTASTTFETGQGLVRRKRRWWGRRFADAVMAAAVVYTILGISTCEFLHVTQNCNYYLYEITWYGLCLRSSISASLLSRWIHEGRVRGDQEIRNWKNKNSLRPQFTTNFDDLGIITFLMMSSSK